MPKPVFVHVHPPLFAPHSPFADSSVETGALEEDTATAEPDPPPLVPLAMAEDARLLEPAPPPDILIEDGPMIMLVATEVD